EGLTRPQRSCPGPPIPLAIRRILGKLNDVVESEYEHFRSDLSAVVGSDTRLSIDRNRQSADLSLLDLRHEGHWLRSVRVHDLRRISTVHCSGRQAPVSSSRVTGDPSPLS